MTTTLPTPTHGAEYTNSATGDKFKYDSDAGVWEGFEGIDRSGDSMTGTIAYPDMLINGNTLTADDPDAAGDDDIDWENGWIDISGFPSNVNFASIAYGNGMWAAGASYGSQRLWHS